MRAKAAYLPERVNACVGASRGVQLHVFLGDTPQHIHDLALNGGLVRLGLPAVEVRAVVGDDQLEIAHGARNYQLCEGESPDVPLGADRKIN